MSATTKKGPPERAASLWRQIRRRFQPRRTCIECGFLAFSDGTEAGKSARLTVRTEGAFGWFSDEAAIDCAKHMWHWGDYSPFVTIIDEANRSRWGCSGFLKYHAGRSPKAHLLLEDERRERNYQGWLLPVLAFLGGTLLGVWLASWRSGIL